MNNQLKFFKINGNLYKIIDAADDVTVLGEIIWDGGAFFVGGKGFNFNFGMIEEISRKMKEMNFR